MLVWSIVPLKFGIGVNAELGYLIRFDRKNHFYPDLPKGYQITQMANPIVGEGYIDVVVNEGEKRISNPRPLSSRRRRPRPF